MIDFQVGSQKQVYGLALMNLSEESGSGMVCTKGLSALMIGVGVNPIMMMDQRIVCPFIRQQCGMTSPVLPN